MKSLPRTLFILFLFSAPASAQLGWFEQHDETDVILYSIDMLDAATIIAVGVDGYIIRSTDGGNNWATVDAGTTQTLRRVRWYSSSLVVALGNGGFAMKSSDKGTTWTMLNTGVTKSLLDVHFFDENNWLVVGQSAQVLTTSDGGATWDDEGNSTNNYNEIAFHGDFGVIVGNKGTLRVTTNGGEKWRSRSSTSDLELTSVDIADDGTAVLVGANGTIVHTADTGRTWNAVYASVPISALRLSGVRFLTPQRGVIVGYGGIILETMDGGRNWTPQVSNTQINIEAVAFADSRVGNSAGWNATIMRTTSGGSLAVTQLGTARPSSLGIDATWPQPLSRSMTETAHIKFDLPSTANVQLRVYDLLGREVSSLLSRDMNAGTWDITWNPSGLSKGVYLYHLTADTHSQTAKFVVVD